MQHEKYMHNKLQFFFLTFYSATPEEKFLARYFQNKQKVEQNKLLNKYKLTKKTSVQKISRLSISDFFLCFAGKFSKEERLSSSIIYLLYNLLLTGIEGHC